LVPSIISHYRILEKLGEGGHSVPRTQLVKETLAWLDRYFGPAE
jgi:hypothetical protein